jgi:hypothetical protein
MKMKVIAKLVNGEEVVGLVPETQSLESILEVVSSFVSERGDFLTLSPLQRKDGQFDKKVFIPKSSVVYVTIDNSEEEEVEENNKEEEEEKECDNCAHLHSPEECKKCGVIRDGEDKGGYKNWKKIAINMVRCPKCLKDFTKVYVINWNEHGKNGPFVCPHCTGHVFNIGELKLEKEDNNETAN